MVDVCPMLLGNKWSLCVSFGPVLKQLPRLSLDLDKPHVRLNKCIWHLLLVLAIVLAKAPRLFWQNCLFIYLLYFLLASRQFCPPC